jgi:hypothetical protein
MRLWTPETDREADVLYRTFSYAKIRHHQDLIGQQIAIAYARRNTDALEDLNAANDALARELRRRLIEGGDTGRPLKEAGRNKEEI